MNPPASAVKEIIRAASEAFGIPAADILSGSRTREVSWARFMIASEIARERSWWPLRRVAEAIGRQDHATAINALRRHSELLSADPGYKAQFYRFTALLQQQPR